MLTEGAKPGTPHITPRKIYPDGIDLFIEVKSSPLLMLQCICDAVFLWYPQILKPIVIVVILIATGLEVKKKTLQSSLSSVSPKNCLSTKVVFYAFGFCSKFCNRRRSDPKQQSALSLSWESSPPFVLATFFRENPNSETFFKIFTSGATGRDVPSHWGVPGEQSAQYFSRRRKRLKKLD